MRFSQSASWQFREADSQFLHLALFARYAAGLIVAPSADIPPHLAGEPRSSGGLAEADQQAKAGQEWRTWWAGLLRHVVSDARRRWTEDIGDLDELLITMRRDHEAVFDPPDFQTLADMPALRTVVVTTFGPGLEWMSRRARPPAQGPQHGAFSWEAVRNAAENAAAERGVPLDEIKAAVHVLDVEGLWSYLVAPGCAICSSPTAASPDAARRLLSEVFGSQSR
jgi:hypothetical protein